MAAVHFTTTALQFTYPGYDIFSDRVVNLYLSFLVMNVLHLVVSLGFLFLFYKVAATRK